MNLTNKNIIVTGASSGIGKTTAIILSSFGANLIICGRNENRLLETYNELQNKENHKMFFGDLNLDENINELTSISNSIDGIVLAAGIVKTLPIKFLNSNELNNVLTSNFVSPTILCQKLLKKKKINASGSIVFVSSIAGNLIGDKGNGAYAASKAALDGISKVMAVELAPQKIRVNCICPGMVKTPMTKTELAAVTLEQLKLNESLYPLGYGEPEDVANGIAFLLSDNSKWITGSSLIIDGGFSIT